MTTTTNGAATLAPRTPGRIGQGTAVEQSRAVAEVEAAVIVAQRWPRSIDTAVREMHRSCARKELADRAFFRYSRGGQQISGPSVQLARELARCWGNTQYGLTELRRDDSYGQSEMQAWAWDVQTNTRASTTFIVPHRRDKTGGPVTLTDMRDIYENNANNGARRLREMIFAILPGWYTEEAIGACYDTLNGEGGDLAERVAKAIEGFALMKVTGPQLEQKLGAPHTRWTAADLAQLSVIYRSIQRGEAAVEDEFPAAAAAGRVTAEEITGNGASVPEPPQERHGPTQAGKPLLDKLEDRLSALDLGPDEDVDALIRMVAGPAYSATTGEVRMVVKYLDDHLKTADGDVEAARSAIWEQFRKAAERAGNSEASDA